MWNKKRKYFNFQTVVNNDLVSHPTSDKGDGKIYLSINKHHHQVDLLVQIHLSLSPSLSVIRCSWQVLKTTSCVRTELSKVSSCWSAKTGASIWRERYLWVRRCFSSSIYIYIYTCVCVCVYTGGNDKIVVLKKTTLQLNSKTFIEKINSGNLIM